MGHLDQERASIWSTNNIIPSATDRLEKETDVAEQDPGNMQTQNMYIAVK